MLQCYSKMIKVYWDVHDTTKSSKKIHKNIAALICHQEKRSPYAAILSTGTLHKDTEVCSHGGSHGTCDGHAESIIYEAAPKYFMNEMANLLKEEGNESIFEHLPNNKGFKLKSNIKFYLMVTEPPCGFIQNQENPCMEWKIPFVDYPHVPTCSSRILIGATMGIQGYVSHLLEDPIMIDSVIILCSKGEELHKTDFTSSFPLPNIKTRRYDPREFANFEPSKEAEKAVSSTPIMNKSMQNTSSENIAVRLNSSSSDQEKASESSLTVTGTDRNVGLSFLAFNPRTGEQESRISGFLIKRDVDDCIEIDEMWQVHRKEVMEKLYTNLCKRLELENALLKLQAELLNVVKNKRIEMSSLINFASMALNRIPDTLDDLLQSTEVLNKTAAEQKWIDHSKSIKEKVDTIEEKGADIVENQAMITYIKDILSKHKEIVMDCSWHHYFFMLPENKQPTD